MSAERMADAVAAVLQRYGVSVLRDKERLSRALAEIAPDLTRERSLFARLYSLAVGELFADVLTEKDPARKRQLFGGARALVARQSGAPQAQVEEFLSYFEDALCSDGARPRTVSAPQPVAEVRSVSPPAQTASAPAAEPVDHAKTARKRKNKVNPVFPAVIAALVVLVLFLLWQLLRRDNIPAPESSVEVSESSEETSGSGTDSAGGGSSGGSAGDSADSSQTEQPLLGDADGDGKVTLEDMQAVNQAAQNAVVGESGLTDAQAAVMDVDGDGSVTLADAQLIGEYIAREQSEGHPPAWEEILPE